MTATIYRNLLGTTLPVPEQLRGERDTRAENASLDRSLILRYAQLRHHLFHSVVLCCVVLCSVLFCSGLVWSGLKHNNTQRRGCNGANTGRLWLTLEPRDRRETVPLNDESLFLPTVVVLPRVINRALAYSYSIAGAPFAGFRG